MMIYLPVALGLIPGDEGISSNQEDAASGSTLPADVRYVSIFSPFDVIRNIKLGKLES